MASLIKTRKRIVNNWESIYTRTCIIKSLEKVCLFLQLKSCFKVTVLVNFFWLSACPVLFPFMWPKPEASAAGAGQWWPILLQTACQVWDLNRYQQKKKINDIAFFTTMVIIYIKMASIKCQLFSLNFPPERIFNA
jgi:hypothetical protein